MDLKGVKEVEFTGFGSHIWGSEGKVKVFDLLSQSHSQSLG